MAEPPGRITIYSRVGDQASQCQELSILSANLWHDWPRHRRQTERLEAFAQIIDSLGVDFVLLQEVARTPALHVDEWLAHRLGMHSAYTRANGHVSGIGFEEGLAILSRFPLDRLHLRQLGCGQNPFVRRIGLGTVVSTPCGDLTLFSVHLGLSRRQNPVQLNHLLDWVEEVAGELPSLIGGDFNTPETSPQIRQAQATWVDTFRSLHPGERGHTHELRWPWGGVLRRSRLDYIFIRSGAHTDSWQILEAAPLSAAGRPLSDHQPVYVRLAWAPAPLSPVTWPAQV